MPRHLPNRVHLELCDPIRFDRTETKADRPPRLVPTRRYSFGDRTTPIHARTPEGSAPTIRHGGGRRWRGSIGRRRGSIGRRVRGSIGRRVPLVYHGCGHTSASAGCGKTRCLLVRSNGLNLPKLCSQTQRSSSSAAKAPLRAGRTCAFRLAGLRASPEPDRRSRHGKVASCSLVRSLPPLSTLHHQSGRV